LQGLRNLQAAQSGVQSESLSNEQRRQFRILKENLARQGINVEGSDPQTATADTTAGIQQLEAFKRKFASTREQQRQFELTAGSGTLQNQQQFNLQQEAQKFSQLGALSQQFQNVGTGLDASTAFNRGITPSTATTGVPATNIQALGSNPLAQQQIGTTAVNNNAIGGLTNIAGGFGNLSQNFNNSLNTQKNIRTQQGATNGGDGGAGAAIGTIIGAKIQFGCFDAMMIISTRDGDKYISDIKVGDDVMADRTFAKVIDIKTDNKPTEIRVNNIYTTPAHPFVMEDGMILPAGGLYLGDKLHDGEEVTVLEKITGNSESRYNLNVEGHRYRVNGVLVHDGMEVL